MSLKVFFRRAAELRFPETLELTPEGLRLKKEERLALHPLKRWSFPGKILSAERTLCDQLLVLLEDGRLLVAEEGLRVLLSTRAEALAAFSGGLFLVGQDRIRLLSSPQLRELHRFRGPGQAVLSATVRRKRLYVLTSSHEVWVYTLSGRKVTRVRVSPSYRALKAQGFLYWFDGANLIRGRSRLPLDRPRPRAFFLPGRGGPWFLESEGTLLAGQRITRTPPAEGARISFLLPGDYSEGLLFLAGKGSFRIIFPQTKRAGRLARIPSTQTDLRVEVELFGEETVLAGVLAVPAAVDLLELVPPVYREKAEELLLPLLTAFRLLHDGILLSKDLLFQSLSGEGDQEELRFPAQILGFTEKGLAGKELRNWLKALPELYRYRGSVYGMREVLRRCVGSRAFLHEAIGWSKTEREGGPFSRLFGRQGNLFLVFLSPEVPLERIALVREMVPQWTPLGTEGRVWPLKRRLVLGEPLALGLNTVLARAELVIGQSRLGQDSRLAERGLCGRLDLRATLGRGARI